jgi:hypothetical protein
MTIADAMTAKAQSEVAALVSEPVLGVAFCNRCGTLDTIVARQITVIATGGASGGGYRVPVDEIHRDGGKPTPLPPAFLLGVTATKVHIYKVRMIMGRVSLKGELGVFDRRGLDVSVEDGGLTTRFGMWSPAMRQGMAFEILKSEYATDFARLLQQPAEGPPVPHGG